MPGPSDQPSWRNKLAAALARPGVRAGLAFVLALIVLTAGMVAVENSLRGARADLTRSQRYSLAEATNQVVAGMKDRVTLRLYYTPRLGEEIPAYADYFDRVRNLLREYEARSNGKLDVRVVKPEPFSEAEDRAVAAGLNQIPVGDGSNDSVLFGIVATNMVDQREVIPFLSRDRQASLEFKLTRMVYSLSRPDEPTVGILTELPLDGGRPSPMRRGGNNKPWVIYEKLKEVFQVEMLSPDSVARQGRIPENVDSLMVVHPKDLSKRTHYAIDQFALKGGGLMAFVDPHSTTALRAGRRRMPRQSASSLTPLFDSWGLSMAGDKVVADLAYAQAVRAQQGTGTVKYPIWLNLKNKALNPTDVATAQARRVFVASAGALKRGKDAAVDWTPLLTSSGETDRVKVDKILRPEPAKILRSYSAGKGRAVLAARLSGKPGTAFPDGPPEAPQPDKQKQNQQGGQGQQNADKPEPTPAKALQDSHVKQAQRSLRAVVFADTDILGDRFWVQERSIAGQTQRIPRADNGDVVLNAMESLTGKINLAEIRAKDRSAPTFTRIERMERRTAQKYRQKRQKLRKQVDQIQKRLSRLRGTGSGSLSSGKDSAILSEKQEKAIDRARRKLLQTREELRRVKRQAREERERLRRAVKIVNIAGMPVVVALIAVALGIGRAVRRRRRA